MATKIDLRVVKIIEPEIIVINAGSDDQINSNMEFLVYSTGEEILDPYTGKNLGILENPKGRFKPMHIQEKMSTLISKAKRPSKIALTFAGFSEIDVENDLLKTIKVGDKVKIINEK